MYTAHLDALNQRFVIRKGDEKIVERLMPVERLPNPGQEILMSEPENQQTWKMVKDLVDAANQGHTRRVNKVDCRGADFSGSKGVTITGAVIKR